MEIRLCLWKEQREKCIKQVFLSVTKWRSFVSYALPAAAC